MNQPVNISSFEDAVIETGGNKYMRNGKGDLVPIENIKDTDRLQDDVVRKIAAYALELNAQISRFKEHTFDDISTFEFLLAEKHQASIGGSKGNKTLMTFDGLKKVQVQVADFIDFGPELQIAKSLIDECLNEWSADSRPEIRAIITRAFNTDKEGKINRAEIFTLMRLDIEDDRWKRAMDAIREAMRVVSSKTYVRFYERDSFDAPWKAISIDLAKVA